VVSKDPSTDQSHCAPAEGYSLQRAEGKGCGFPGQKIGAWAPGCGPFRRIHSSNHRRPQCYPIQIMHMLYFCALSLTALLPGFAQTTANAGPGLPTDPREVFAAAAPFYDFTSPDLKPWHLKATYQLYDEKGNPGEQGTYEYWWASPQVYRSTWTRAHATHTDWHLTGGRPAHQETGERLKFFEYNLQVSLLSPLPNTGDLDPAKFHLDRQSVKLGGVQFPCIMIVPRMPKQALEGTAQLGLFPTYCFDTQFPILRAEYSFGTVTSAFNKIVYMQKRYLPGGILFLEGKRKILSAEIDPVTALDPSDPALTPAAGVPVANFVKVVRVSADVSSGRLIKKQVPVYPQDAQQARISGTVVLKATIGTDGGIHNLQVISAPSPSLAASALFAVSEWVYKPYLLNGEPVEVQSTVNVIYTLGH